MMMQTIDLDRLTGNGKVHNLSGHVRGLAARTEFGLDDLDTASAQVRVIVPDHVYSLSPSFVQGLFSASVKALGNNPETFFSHYEIVASDLVRRQIDRAMLNITLDRDFTAN